jgi:hypothetical protein
MEKLLEEKLDEFEEEHNWWGMSSDMMAEVTLFTLGKLKEYLDETGAANEASAIQTALDYAEVHLET